MASAGGWQTQERRCQLTRLEGFLKGSWNIVETSSCACEVSIETYAAFVGSKTVVSKSHQIGTHQTSSFMLSLSLFRHHRFRFRPLCYHAAVGCTCLALARFEVPPGHGRVEQQFPKYTVNISASNFCQCRILWRW